MQRFNIDLSRMALNCPRTPGEAICISTACVLIVICIRPFARDLFVMPILRRRRDRDVVVRPLKYFRGLDQLELLRLR